MKVNGTALAAARRRVIRQLLESMLHEGIIEQSRIRKIYEDAAEVPAAECQWVLTGASRDGSPVEYQFRGYASCGFGRIRIVTPVLRVDADREDTEGQEVMSIPLLLSELLPAESFDSENEKLAHFVRELEHTVRNDSIHPTMEADAKEGLSLTALEAMTSTGHPYHPSYKSRIGFSLRDHEAYAPEFAPSVRLEWIAVQRSYAEAHTLSTVSYEGLMEHVLGAHNTDELLGKLSESGRDPTEYILIPVHPWQWEHVLLHSTVSLQEQDIIVPLGTGTEYYQPLQSIRTLANISSPYKPNIKLSMQIMNTSALRIIGAHHIRNAPAISEWLYQLWSQDAYLREHCNVIVLREIAGVCLTYEALPAPQERLLNGSMSAVYRESVEALLSPGEEAAPYTIVTHRDVSTGNLAIRPWVEKYGVEKWLRRLLEVTLQPMLHLLYHYGVGLESHGQNMVLIHTNGWPERIALRDLPGGIRAIQSEELFPTRPKLPRLASKPGESQHPILIKKPEEIRDYWMDALFHIQFYEVSIFLREQFGLQEEQFWMFAAQEVRLYQQRYPEQEHLYRLFDLEAEKIMVGQLTVRKIRGEGADREHMVPNPLSMWLRQHQFMKEEVLANGCLDPDR